MNNNTQNRSTPFEALESRQLLSSAPWSAQDQQINLDKAVAAYPHLTGAGETVVIIDRGVDYNHSALGGGFGKKIIAGWDFEHNTGDVYPYDGIVHGTGTAGQIAADPHVVNGYRYQGIAPGVKIIALRTLGTAETKAAMDWIIAQRTTYNIVAVNYLDQGGADQSQFLWELQTLRDAGVFMAGAVGNYGPGPAYGSINDLIYLVGAVDKNDVITNFTPRGSAVEMVAPGQKVDVTWNVNGTSTDIFNDGTSWAAPQVTGTAALIKQINPSFTPPQILSIMRDSAKWVYDATSNAYYPRLDVYAALTLAYQRNAPATPAPVPPPAAATPFKGTPFNVGDVIQAEDYDNGGEGIAYHDTTNWNEGGDGYRSDPGVDSNWTSDGNGSHFVGWTQAGEWMNYSITAAKSGAYTLSSRVSCLGSGGSFHVEIDGKDATGSISIPNTGDWNGYVTLNRTIGLTAGKHTMRVVMEAQGASGFLGNFNWFKLSESTGTVGSGNGNAAQVNLKVGSPTTSSLDLSWSDTTGGTVTYVLERSNRWNGRFHDIATLQTAHAARTRATAVAAASTKRTYTDKKLRAGKRYYYRLKVVTASGTAYTVPVGSATLPKHH